MSEFNIFERKVSKFIKRFSYVHKLVKYLYQYLNFFLKSDKNFSLRFIQMLKFLIFQISHYFLVIMIIHPFLMI